MRRGAILAGLGLAALAGLLAYDRVPRQDRGGEGESPAARLVAENLPIAPGAAGAIRLGIDSAEPAARVIATLREGTGVLLCPLAAPAASLPAPERCANAASGVRETVASPSGRITSFAVVLPEGPATRLGLRVEYTERTRRVSVRMPALERPFGDCADNACNPFFEMTPTRAGDFQASATWAGGEATLALLEGSVLARSFTATGAPYGVPAERSGHPPVSIEARLSAPAEYALALTSIEGDLRDVEIDARWP